MKKQLYFSLDIEGTGKTLKHPINAYGYCIGDRYGNISDCGECHIKTDKSVLEPQCKEEFYDKHPGLWEELQKGAIDPKDAARLLDTVSREKAEKEGYQTILISDCPDYDIARLDAFLYEHLERDPLRYDSKGNRRWVVDPSERASAFGKNIEEACQKEADDKVEHDHRPMNDAIHHYHLYLETLNVTEAIEEGRFTN